ncbi:MAG TPA: glycosyltransferase [Candidatus Sulfomarinibacteraceae bacterium]|nr:glycosyltransferase [Candidatus Sulfomarinibacteraceae bacterium]
MIVHSYYEEDPRVRRQAESLVAAGREVDVLALRRPGDPPRAALAGVNVRRLDVQRHQGAGLATYLLEYLAFLVRASLAAVVDHRRRRYGLVQVHSLPDFLVLAALPLRLVGVPVLLDLHEAMPEFFRSRFPRAGNPIVHRLLLFQERLSVAAATEVLTVNEALRDRLVELGANPGRVGVAINSPSLERFDPTSHPTRAFMADGTLRLVYAGALTPTYELDVLLDAVSALRTDRPDLPVRLDLYGRGDSEPELRARAARLGLADEITFHGRIPIEAVPAAIAAADIGLAPTRRDRFTDISLSTKIFEYAAMGKPVVCSALPMVERTFPGGVAVTYRPGEPAALAAAIGALVDDPAAREASVRGMLALTRTQAWEVEAPRYVAIVERLART